MNSHSLEASWASVRPATLRDDSCCVITVDIKHQTPQWSLLWYTVMMSAQLFYCRVMVGKPAGTFSYVSRLSNRLLFVDAQQLL